MTDVEEICMKILPFRTLDHEKNALIASIFMKKMNKNKSLFLSSFGVYFAMLILIDGDVN